MHCMKPASGPQAWGPGGSSSLVVVGGGAYGAYELFNQTPVPPDAHPWTSFEPTVSGGKQQSVLGQRPCWPE